MLLNLVSALSSVAGTPTMAATSTVGLESQPLAATALLNMPLPMAMLQLTLLSVSSLMN